MTTEAEVIEVVVKIGILKNIKAITDNRHESTQTLRYTFDNPTLSGGMYIKRNAFGPHPPEEIYLTVSAEKIGPCRMKR
jgi:hypothetical protein